MDSHSSLFMAYFAAGMKVARQRRGVSQADVASLAALSVTTVNQAERAIKLPELATLEKIAASLDTVITDIVEEGRRVTLQNLSEARRRLAVNIKCIRTERNMTQSEMAAASCLSLSTVANIENCRKAATVDALDQLAAALGVDVSSLLLK